VLKIAETNVSLETNNPYSAVVISKDYSSELELNEYNTSIFAREYRTSLFSKYYSASISIDSQSFPDDKLLLLETGFEFLLESGDRLLLEA